MLAQRATIKSDGGDDAVSVQQEIASQLARQNEILAETMQSKRRFRRALVRVIVGVVAGTLALIFLLVFLFGADKRAKHTAEKSVETVATE